MKIEELSVGQRVRYSYGAPALTCNMNGVTYHGEGVIEEIAPPSHEPYIGVGRTWLFPREIIEVVE